MFSSSSSIIVLLGCDPNDIPSLIYRCFYTTLDISNGTNYKNNYNGHSSQTRGHDDGVSRCRHHDLSAMFPRRLRKYRTLNPLPDK